MEAKDWVTLLGIAATLLISSINLAYTWWSTRKSAFINVVTASRIKWIESLRDKVSAYIAATELLVTALPETAGRNVAGLLRDRDTLLRQIILHLNPTDVVDQKIATVVRQIQGAASNGVYTEHLSQLLDELQRATGEYLHKEWNKVKQEAKYGEHA